MPQRSATITVPIRPLARQVILPPPDYPTTISLLERGKRQPSLGTIFMLAAGLAVEPERLVREVRKLRPKLPV